MRDEAEPRRRSGSYGKRLEQRPARAGCAKTVFTLAKLRVLILNYISACPASLYYRMIFFNFFIYAIKRRLQYQVSSLLLKRASVNTPFSTLKIFTVFRFYYDLSLTATDS